MGELKYVFGRIKGLLLLLATQLLSAVFTIIKEPRIATFPDEYPETHAYFLFSDYELTRSTYWYFMFEHLIVIIYAAYILITGVEFRTALRIFLLIQIIDLLDYLLAYGEIWFYASTFPISWNVLKAVFFSLAIANEVIQMTEKRIV